jgi:hypothetical protein
MPKLKTAFIFALICIIGVAMLLGSASSPSTRVRAASPKLPDSDFDRYSGVGKCSIIGQAFLKTRGGDVKYGAGETVMLMPDIPFLNQMHEIQSSPDRYLYLPPDVDSKWKQLRRQTITDGAGEFEFKGIPCGSWYVESQVRWEVPTYSTQGGTVSTRINVNQGNSPVKVILTR